MELQEMGADLSRLISNEWIKDLGILVIIYILLSFVSSFLKRTINRKFTDNSTRLKLRTIVGIGFALVFGLFSMALFSDKIAGLSVALGVAGAGIAFALQEVIASVAGWFAIHFGNFFSIGDRILLGGIRGDVVDIGLLRTTVMELGQWVQADQYNGRVVRIANSFVFKEPVYNYSADFPFLWDEIVIPVKYGSNLKLTKELIKKIADEHLDEYEKMAEREWKSLVDKYVIENAQVDNQVYMTADQNWVSFTLRYVTDFKSRRKTKDILFEKILMMIDENSDSVGIAGSTIEVVGDKEFFKNITYSEKNQQPHA